MQLWSKHLDIVGDTRPELRDRVRARMLSVLIRLDLNARKGNIDQHYGWIGWRDQGLARLDAQQRRRYRWKTGVINPLKVLLGRD